MRCLPRPRNRGRSSTFLCPYQTSTRSRYNRASTCAPIKRLFTEYAFRSTWIRLPESTFTRSRLADSIRRAGNSRITAISSDNRARRPAFRCAKRSLRNCAYSARLPKSRLPRSSSVCSTARLNRWWLCSASPFSFGLAGLVCLRLDSVIPHHPFIAPVELLQIAHVVHRARQAVGTVLGSHCSQFPDRVLPSFAEALQALRIADRARLPVRVRQHEVIHQVLERLPPERDPQLGHVREVRRAQPSRRVLLTEVHFLRRPL